MISYKCTYNYLKAIKFHKLHILLNPIYATRRYHYGYVREFSTNDDTRATDAFYIIDTDNSEAIDCRELVAMYKHAEFQPNATKVMMRTLTDETVIDVGTYIKFDNYLNYLFAAFSTIRQEWIFTA